MTDAPPTTDQTTTWLHQLYGTTEHGWLTIFTLNRTTGDRRTDWAPTNNLTALAAAAIEREPTSCVWFGVATRRQRLTSGSRGRTEDCTAIPGLWADIDIEGPGHASGHNLAPNLDAALALVARFPLPPTAIVNTGGGIQAWWLFNELIDLNHGTRQTLTAWGATWTRHGTEAGIHVDNVFDPARIMRLPGTTNRKAGLARPVTILQADWATRYGLDDIDQHLDPPPPPPPRTTPGHNPLSIQRPDLPGSDFNTRHTGNDILQRAGFTPGHTDPNGDQHWTRPGKDTRDGTSATVYADDGHTTIWSDTCTAMWPALELRRPYDPFGGVAPLRWTPDSGGDPGGRRPGWVVQRSTPPSSVVRRLPL